jgi:hypothetical protein
MKNIILKYFSIAVLFLAVLSCEDYPIDDDGLLITERSDCYVSNFELLGSDHETVRDGMPIIDTLAQTIDVKVKFGTNLSYLWPQFSLSEDAKLEPKITGFVDFSDLDNPRKYTVVSGNRKVKKEYTIRVSVSAL